MNETFFIPIKNDNTCIWRLCLKQKALLNFIWRLEITIVIGNVIGYSGRLSGSSIICGWTWIPENTSTQAVSEYIKCKHWMCEKIKATVFFMRPDPWSTDISLFYCSDISVFNWLYLVRNV